MFEMFHTYIEVNDGSSEKKYQYAGCSDKPKAVNEK